MTDRKKFVAPILIAESDLSSLTLGRISGELNGPA
jgi:hypothetical protein